MYTGPNTIKSCSHEGKICAGSNVTSFFFFLHGIAWTKMLLAKHASGLGCYQHYLHGTFCLHGNGVCNNATNISLSPFSFWYIIQLTLMSLLGLPPTKCGSFWCQLIVLKHFRCKINVFCSNIIEETWLPSYIPEAPICGRLGLGENVPPCPPPPGYDLDFVTLINQGYLTLN